MSLEAFSRTVTAIHAASAAPDRWPAAIAEVVQLLRASKGALLDIDLTTGNLIGVTSLGHDPAAQQAYVEHYSATDPTLRAAYSIAPREPFTAHGAFPAALRAHHEYFDFARTIDIGDAIAICTDGIKGIRTVLSLQRPFAAKSYNDEMRRVISLLAPHVDIAKHVQAKLADALTAHLTLAAGLDRFAAAAFILDAAGAILHLNAAAEAILAKMTGIRVRHGKLSFAEPCLNAAIEAAVLGATQTAPRSTLLPLGKGGAQTAELMVSPLHPMHELVTPWQAPLALLVITEPRRDSESIARRVRVLYGLTAAEARVMAAIALGADVEEIMQTFGVKEPTVRAQLRSIFGKTGVARQSDLVRLALAGAPLRDDEID